MIQIKKAYRQAWDDHYAEIEKFCLFRLRRDRSLAEDCCQEVFKAYWEALRKGKEVQNPRAWLYKVADVVVKKAQKQIYTAMDQVPLDELEQKQPSVEVDFVEELIKLRFSDDDLLRLLGETLTSEEYELFRCCFIEKEPPEVTAERMGITTNHLYKKKCVFKKKLQKKVYLTLQTALKETFQK